MDAFSTKRFFQNVLTLSDPDSTKQGHRNRLPREIVRPSTKPNRVQGAPGCSEAYDLVIGNSLRTREWESMSLVGLFQSELFCDSMILCEHAWRSSRYQHCRAAKLDLEVNIVCCSWLSALFERVQNTVFPAGLNTCFDCKLVGLNDIHLQAAALGLTQYNLATCLYNF